jgi:hypothetical protein
MRHDEHDIIDDRPGRYYVSARNDAGDAIPLLGPYDSHVEALEHVALGRDLANVVDPRACWYSYGTFRAHDDIPAPAAIFAPESTVTRPVLIR